MKISVQNVFLCSRNGFIQFAMKFIIFLFFTTECLFFQTTCLSVPAIQTFDTFEMTQKHYQVATDTLLASISCVIQYAQYTYTAYHERLHISIHFNM